MPGASSQTDVPPLTVHYQPVVELDTGRVVGAEALLRFVGEDGSLRAPGEAGLIERIEQDERAVEAMMERVFACLARDASPLLDRVPGFYIGVNIPPSALGSGAIARIMEELDLVRHAPRLVAEVTERQALTPVGRDALHSAREQGVRIAVDDFGTGESGLKQLLGLEFDILKIDRTQVAPLLKDRSADRLLRGVVALAGALRVKVTGEGVETPEQAFFLRAAGVDCGQGWFWSRAAPIEAFESMLDSGFAGRVVGGAGGIGGER